MDNQLRHLRLVLTNTEAPSQEITIDLIFDGKGVRHGLDYFGLWQDKDNETRCPFVMDPNGSVDFGTGYDGQDRYYETNILQTELAVGENVGWSTGEYDQVFCVVSMTQLG
jgi:hypothetical protein